MEMNHIFELWTHLGGERYGNVSTSSTTTRGVYEVYIDFECQDLTLLDQSITGLIWRYLRNLLDFYPDLKMSFVKSDREGEEVESIHITLGNPTVRE